MKFRCRFWRGWALIKESRVENRKQLKQSDGAAVGVILIK